MTEPVLPSIPVEPQAIDLIADLIAHDAGLTDPPPLEEKDGKQWLTRQAWEEWIDQKEGCSSWCRFSDLFKAQAYDGDPSSLSLKDVNQKGVTSASPLEAEQEFVHQYGYPEAIILPGNDVQVLRLSNGSFWQALPTANGYSIQPLDPTTGENQETEMANQVLQQLDEQFQTAGYEQRLALKRTMRSPASSSAPPIGVEIPTSESEINLQFAGRVYPLENPNARIAYLPDSPYGRYYHTQPQNGCVAASTLNGAIFAQTGILNDPKLLTLFYEKLKTMQDSPDGRIYTDRLEDDITAGKIPGLAMRNVPLDEIAGLVEKQKTVIALVPYFNGHAFLVLGVNPDKGTYKAMDTVTGMVVEEKLPPSEEAPPQSSVVEDPATPSSDGAISDAETEKMVDSIAEIFENIRTKNRNTTQETFPRPPSSPPLIFGAPPPISGSYGSTPTRFTTVEFKDPQAFVRWIES